MVTPTKPLEDFYRIYSEYQIIDIITSIEKYKEIPFKYCHFETGALYWDFYVETLYSNKTPSSINRTIDSIKRNTEYFLAITEKFRRINIIDIGVGNGRHIKDLIDLLLAKNKIIKYIAIDISKKHLEVTKNNLKEWFGEDILYDEYVRDITLDDFKDINFLTSKNAKSIITFLGSTIENQKDYFKTLKNIQESFSKDDLFILGHILDTKKERTELHFNTTLHEVKDSDLYMMSVVIDLLNINPHDYDFIRYYDETHKSRIVRITFKKDIEILIQSKQFEHLLRFPKGEELIVFRHNHHSKQEVIDLLEAAEFKIEKIDISPEENQIMVFANSDII